MVKKDDWHLEMKRIESLFKKRDDFDLYFRTFWYIILRHNFYKKKPKSSSQLIALFYPMFANWAHAENVVGWRFRTWNLFPVIFSKFVVECNCSNKIYKNCIKIGNWNFWWNLYSLSRVQDASQFPKWCYCLRILQMLELEFPSEKQMGFFGKKNLEIFQKP